MGLSIREIIATYNPDAHLSESVNPAIILVHRSSHSRTRAKTVLSQSWQFVGRTNQLRDPGNYITCDVAGEPIVVVVGNDNVLRGFFNVWPSSRRAAVMTKSEGRTENLALSSPWLDVLTSKVRSCLRQNLAGSPILTAPRTGLFRFKLRSGRTGCS